MFVGAVMKRVCHDFYYDISCSSKKKKTSRSRMQKQSSFRRGFVKSKSFDRRDDSRKDRNFMRVDQGSRMSKRVYIRRSSSVEIPRTKRFSSGATDLKAKERRKRYGHAKKFANIWEVSLRNF